MVVRTRFSVRRSRITAIWTNCYLHNQKNCIRKRANRAWSRLIYDRLIIPAHRFSLERCLELVGSRRGTDRVANVKRSHIKLTNLNSWKGCEYFWLKKKELSIRIHFRLHVRNNGDTRKGVMFLLYGPSRSPVDESLPATEWPLRHRFHWWSMESGRFIRRCSGGQPEPWVKSGVPGRSVH